MMSVAMAEKVAQFYENNDISYTQIMGGECFMNPDWEQIFRLILPKVKRARVVTNGDWSIDHLRFADVLAEFPQVLVAISNDEWHTNRNVQTAAKACEDRGIELEVCKDGGLTEKGIVPIGNSDMFYSAYSAFQCWCHKPDRMYSFLITESGEIFKCDMGVWNYDNISNFIEGGFDIRFKEFSKLFYEQFIGNCAVCGRAYNNSIRKKALDFSMNL